MDTRSVLPAAILLSCAALASSFTLLSRSHVRKTNLDANVNIETTSYQVGLVKIQLPAGSGGHSILQKLAHDDLIAKAVSQVKGSLYVYITIPSSSTSAPILRFSTTW